MSFVKHLPSSATILALAGLIVSPPLTAAETTPLPSRVNLNVQDVTLDQGDLLRGRVIGEDAAPAEVSSIQLLRDGRRIGSVTTGEDGTFSFRIAQGGTYQLIVDGQTTTVRVWTYGAAPPNTPSQLMLTPSQVVRGQQQALPPYSQVNPWVIAGVVAAAVAIPIVIHNNRSERGNGS